jgi:hypothetical protein
MFTLAFWKAAGERAVKTFAQSFIASLAVAYGLEGVDWKAALSAAALATLLSVLSSVASSQIGGPGPSVVDAEKLNPPPPADPEAKGGVWGGA